MDNLKLGDIADVQFGPHIKTENEGSIKYLLAGHFNNNFKPTVFSGSYVEESEKTFRFRLQPNDVILAGKGFRTFAWPYEESFGPAVPSSLFYLLRFSKEIVIGDYLAAVLNSEKSQHQLSLIGAGASITSIPKKELKEIEIPVPSISEQQRFLKIYHLLEKDIELTDELLSQKRILKRGLVNELLTKNYGNKDKK